jgi:7-keto-8-aminopelargonate synthetase-like enzyme
MVTRAASSMGGADSIESVEGLFYMSVLFATLLGTALALMDSNDMKRGGGPMSHVGELVSPMDALFSDGVGLGALEPLWRIATVDGLRWTLFRGWSPRDKATSLGLVGLVSAVGTILSTLFNGLLWLVLKTLCVCRCRRRKEATKTQVDAGKPAHKELAMSFSVEVRAYYAYSMLFLQGLLREYLLQASAMLLRDEISRKYVERDRWSSGWVEFYLQHMYRPILDCFQRPIASAPDACVDVVERTRDGNWFWSCLYDPKPTENAKKCVNLASYNYLGFGGVDEVCTPAAKEACLTYGFSAAGTRTEGGTLPIHRELEREVASYLQKEDAFVLGMGFATNSTILPTLFEAGGKGILVLSDELNHRSIVEGVRLSGATVRAFPHNCMVALESELKKATEEGQSDANGKPFRKIFIVVEGIYSMEGDFCRLREIVTLKNRYRAYLYLDEAHSIGAVGATGRGVTELLGVPTSEIDVMMGTFTKSFGSAGGYVASSKAVIDVVRQSAPGSVFAGAMSPPCAAQAIAALRVISGSIGGDIGARKLAQIRNNSNFFRTRLIEEGFKVLGDEDSPIIPVMLHHPRKMATFSRKCLSRGIAVVIVGYPAVPVLYERVRFCISAAHTRAQLEKVLADVVDIGKELGLMYASSDSATEKATRSTQAAEYTKLLREAPLVSKAEVTPATSAVADWSPEPLAPHATSSKLAIASLEVASSESLHKSGDFRLIDPLGYAAELLPAAREAAEATLSSYGFGACGPRGFYGSTWPHLHLEAAVAKFLCTESAILYSAGVTTVSSVLPALIQRGDRVILDTEVHLGIRAGLRLCRASIKWVPQGDLDALEAALKDDSNKQKEKPKRQQQTYIVLEALSQRTGRIAPLAEVVALKEKYGATLLLDESLSFGAYGATGRGVFEHSNIDVSRIDAIIGSLEHAVAGVGGFCAGKKGLVEHQRLAGSGYCFSASSPPSSCSAATAVINDLGSSGASRRSALQDSTKKLRMALQGAIAQSEAPLELISSEDSYVQHIRWSSQTGATVPKDVEDKFVEVAETCSTMSGLRIQACSPAVLCGAEAAFDARIGAPNGGASPSLRACASAASLSSEEIAALGKTLCHCFSKIV